MARVRTIQNTFTSGELDPLLAARTDVKHYYLGAERIRNCLVIPQGGVKRRPGLRYLDELHSVVAAYDLTTATIVATNGGTAGNAIDGTNAEVLTTNNISTTNPYVILHVDLLAAHAIEFVDVEGLRCTAGSSAEVCWQYSTDNAAWTTFGDAFDLVDTHDRMKRRTGPISARYWRLARIGATDMTTAKFAIDEIYFWTATATLSAVRLIEFEFSTSQIYLMVFTDRNCAVYRNGVHQIDVPSPYTSADLRTIDSVTGDITTMDWTQNLDTMLTVHGEHAPRKIFRDGAHDEWNPSLWPLNVKPTYAFSRVTTSTGTPGSAAVGTGVTWTAGGSEFVAGDVGKFIRGNGGYASITAYSSGTSVTVTILDAFDDATAINAGEWTIEEDVWSDARGWPLSALFYQSRLLFGGSRDRPSTFWGSKSSTPYNFSIGDASVIDGIDVTPDTGDVAAISNLFVGRHLQVMTTSREFYFPNSETEGLTPANAFLRSTSKRGAKKGLPVFEVDGATIFVQRYGKALRELIWQDTEQSYQANNLSLLSSHLIGNPVSFAHRRATSTSEADYMLLVNDDGTLTVFNTLRDQGINAFSLCETEGDFVEAGVAGRDMYFAVQRTIDGTVRQFLEKFDEDLLFDCAISGTGVASSTTDADHLIGEDVGVILDDSIQADKTVAGGGTVTFDRASTTDWQVGLHFPDLGDGNECYVRDMSVEPPLPDGTAVGRKKRIVEVVARVYQTTGLWINGNPVAFRQYGSDLLDQPITAFTGDKRYDGLLGWDRKGQVTLSARGPYKFTVLGMAKKVSI